MIVSRLKLANLRALKEAEFGFLPGFNLIAGVNGVGKTSVLRALGVCLSAVVKYANGLRYKKRTFSLNDLRVGTEALTVECEVQLDGIAYTYLVHNPRETSVAQKKMAGEPRAQVHDTPARAEFTGDAPDPLTVSTNGRALAMFFSTRRSLTSAREPSSMASAGGVVAACADAFANRNLRLGEFAAWMRVEQALAVEQPSAKRVLAAFGAAVSRFLPKHSDLRVDDEKPPKLLIDHDGMPLPVSELSDGERGLLAIVFDLTRRLTQANPEMEDPAAEAEAVVLIDEIELHLHPGWQRRIVHNLTAAFPRCQFIATTHSPQVIGEVENDRIQIITDSAIYSPSHSFGVDSNRILEETMSADQRTQDVKGLLSEISQKIGKQRYESARGLLDQLIDRLGEDDPEVTRIRILLDFMEGEE